MEKENEPTHVLYRNTFLHELELLKLSVQRTEKALWFAAGLLSATAQFENESPSEIVNWLLGESK